MSINHCSIKKNQFKTNDLTYRDQWEYFVFSDTLNLKVIHHQKSVSMCGIVSSASVTVGTFKNDTIRMINLCNMEDYSIGKTVNFLPARKPSFSVVLPDKQVYSANNSNLIDYETKILKTTYGYAIRN